MPLAREHQGCEWREKGTLFISAGDLGSFSNLRGPVPPLKFYWVIGQPSLSSEMDKTMCHTGFSLEPLAISNDHSSAFSASLSLTDGKNSDTRYKACSKNSSDLLL